MEARPRPTEGVLVVVVVKPPDGTSDKMCAIIRKTAQYAPGLSFTLSYHALNSKDILRIKHYIVRTLCKRSTTQ